MPDRVFWSSTPAEVRIVVDAANERRHSLEEARAKAASYRTAFIAAEIKNQWVKKGRRPYRPEDFLPRPKRRWTPEEMIAHMRGWASGVNRSAEA